MPSIDQINYQISIEQVKIRLAWTDLFVFLFAFLPQMSIDYLSIIEIFIPDIKSRVSSIGFFQFIVMLLVAVMGILLWYVVSRYFILKRIHKLYIEKTDRLEQELSNLQRASTTTNYTVNITVAPQITNTQ
jgi:hypothetical protein